jgi:hypothetical protein
LPNGEEVWTSFKLKTVLQFRKMLPVQF